MIQLTASGISRQFDVSPVFKNVSFEVRRGERIGLVGPNGTGKTTLLNILAKIDEPDEGQVEWHPSVEVALLEQQAQFSPDRTLLEEAKSGLAHLYQLQSDSQQLANQIAEMAEQSDRSALEKLQKRYDQLQQELLRLDAYNIDHRVDEVLLGLGFDRADYDRPLVQFSGGQQSRALLARLLLHSPDVMLLDEPTNHLDIAATEWLEDFLSKTRQTVILVSHDRYFLDRITTRILELFQATVTDYPGNFTAYWTQREERRKVLERTYEKQQEFIAKTEDFIRRNKYGQKHAQAADREKKLSRLDRVELAQNISELPMSFGEPTRTGDWVIDAVGVSKGFGEPLFSDVTLQVERGARMGILGPNGSGKTTLLRTLIGELPPDEGTIRLGTGVKIGYYDQQLSHVDPEAEAVEAVRQPGDLTTPIGTLRGLLARFGIRGEMAFQKVGSMSGGEKSKVALARLASLNANVLVLDEPTNHLDLWARSSLETALQEFDGTLLFVSHDRYFLDRVATSVVVLEPDRWRYYDGNYSDYVGFLRNQALEQQAQQEAIGRTPSTGEQPANGKSRESSSAQRKKERPAKRRRKFPYRKVDDLEAEIAETESLLEQLQEEMANPDIHRDGQLVKETMQRYEETKLQLEQLYEHWEEAVELNG